MFCRQDGKFEISHRINPKYKRFFVLHGASVGEVEVILSFEKHEISIIVLIFKKMILKVWGRLSFRKRK